MVRKPSKPKMIEHMDVADPKFIDTIADNKKFKLLKGNTTRKNYLSSIRLLAKALKKKSMAEMVKVDRETILKALGEQRGASSKSAYVNALVSLAKCLDLSVSDDIKKLNTELGVIKARKLELNQHAKVNVDDVTGFNQAVKKYFEGDLDEEAMSVKEARGEFLISLYSLESPSQRPHVFEGAVFVNTDAAFDKIKNDKTKGVFHTKTLQFYTPFSKTGQPINASFNYPHVRIALDRYLKKLGYKGGETLMFPIQTQAIRQNIQAAFDLVFPDKGYGAQVLRRITSTLDGFNFIGKTSEEIKARAAEMGHSANMHSMYRIVENIDRDEEQKAAFDDTMLELYRVLAIVQGTADKSKLVKITNALKKIKVSK